ncbi:hypothetical protein VOI54_17015 [Tamlana sp. 2201CG12-4]|uniref:hypothetical protein n=1 Tax=Tamlana sp. 2201CG12-4 TaxID=3112582 RepID=UPI002DBD3032|nr:hypothetical protein [Tamlana sp. 2201CG12-4]MEC3908731.1 hypothetical protein [Tamlana sp. 2201CG12-4]
MEFIMKESLATDEIIIWNLNVETLIFDLASLNFGNANVTSCSFKKFTALIKYCFRGYFIEALKEFEEFLNNRFFRVKNSIYHMEIVLPIHINNKNFTYSLLKVIPETNKGKIKDFCFVLTPIKEYNNEVISMQVFKSFVKCNNTTTYVKNRIFIKTIFTFSQEKVFFLLLEEKGLSSSCIAEDLNKDILAIDKYKIMIHNRLSHFFDINFNTVYDAVDYYKKCFENNIFNNKTITRENNYL